MKYDTEFRKTETGEKLVNKWRTVRKVGCCARWKDFNKFCEDVLCSYDEDVYCISKVDDAKPYSPSNFKWLKKKNKAREDLTVGFAIKWNKTVNRIRNYYGMGNVEDMNANRCVCCGAIIPEGRQVCPSCIAAVNEAQGKENCEQ